MYFKEQRENKVFPGDIKAVVRPDPIPNSAVKRCVADGSACIACARVGRCRGFSLRSDEVSVTPSLLLFFSLSPLYPLLPFYGLINPLLYLISFMISSIPTNTVDFLGGKTENEIRNGESLRAKSFRER